MVNWHDPALLLKDYCACPGLSLKSLSTNFSLDCHLVAIVKLYHAIAGIYMCVRLHRQEIPRTDINLQQPQLGNYVHCRL